MKLKHTLKIMAAGVALAIAGQANASLVSGSTTPNVMGSLFFTAWDTVNNKSYSRDLGLLGDAFLPNAVGGSKSPNSFLQNVFSGDANWTNFLAGANDGTSTAPATSLGNIRWNIVASNTTPSSGAGQRAMFTAPIGAVAGNFTTTNAGMGTLTQNINTFLGNLNTTACGTGAASAGVSCFTNQAGTNFNGSSSFWTGNLGGIGTIGDTSGSVTDELSFWLLTRISNSTFTQATKTQFINTLGDVGKWTLDAATGSVTYTIGTLSAVPVPAAVWLFGSGLLGLIGVARRRKVEPVSKLALA